jgi:hypothetical protein
MAMHTPAGWLVALVQAKNVDGRRFGTYPGLRSDSALRQAESLIHAAAMPNAVPRYVLYNSEVAPFGAAGTPVPVRGCGRQILIRGLSAQGPPWRTQVSPLGVMVAQAEDVYAKIIPPPATNQQASNVNNYTMPWECLFARVGSWRKASAPLMHPRSPGAASSDNLCRRCVRKRSRAAVQPEAFADRLEPELDDDAPRARFFL